uniref:Uncharacterized protein n=1 Tax=Avena sativa TaxID=4498 RepID=A0ACD5X153_AVESA
MLELTGGDCTSDRPGLDLVAVLDVSVGVWDWEIEEVKTAMRFLVRKLSRVDRLSVITFDKHARELWPLRQITGASSLRELEDLISTLEGGWLSSSNGIEEALQAGLNVLADREVCAGRVAAIMLVSSSGQQLVHGDATLWVDVGDVPVYTFFFGGKDSDPMVLHRVAAKSMGGTFSHFRKQDAGGLTMAFSQCLAGLLTVAVQNLELTVAAVRGESRIVKVTAGSYPQEQHKDESVTVRFGNLYSTEVRKVIVELHLPIIYRAGSTEILDVTYSHDHPAGRMKFVAPAETLTLWRTGLDFSEEEKPAGLLSEEARLRTARMVKEARTMSSDCQRLLSGAQHNKLVEAHNMAELQSNSPLLRTELQEVFQLFKTEMYYAIRGCPYTLSWESCHDRQRLVGRRCGMQWFVTPHMDKYLQQAKMFLKEPTMPMPSSSVDEDVNQQVGALTFQDISRSEMWRLSSDVVRMRPPPPHSPLPPTVNSSGGLFRMFQKKQSGSS